MLMVYTLSNSIKETFNNSDSDRLLKMKVTNLNTVYIESERVIERTSRITVVHVVAFTHTRIFNIKVQLIRRLCSEWTPKHNYGPGGSSLSKRLLKVRLTYPNQCYVLNYVSLICRS